MKKPIEKMNENIEFYTKLCNYLSINLGYEVKFKIRELFGHTSAYVYLSESDSNIEACSLLSEEYKIKIFEHYNCIFQIGKFTSIPYESDKDMEASKSSSSSNADNISMII